MNCMQQMTHQTHINHGRHISTVSIKKQSHTRTDPLTDILNNINKNPTAYVTAHASSKNNHSGQCHEQTNNSQNGEAKDKEQYNAVADNKDKKI